MGNDGHEISLLESPQEVRKAGFKILEKCLKQEQKRKKKGYRFIKIGKNTEIFVPCDKDGNPTEEGQRKIARMKKILLI